MKVTSANVAARDLAKLTTRERQILELVLDGYPSKNIAANLGISQRTVENHRQSIMVKAHAKSLPELVRLAVAAKLFSASDPLNLSHNLNGLLDIEPVTAIARAMFEHSPGAMIMIDRSGVILHTNPAITRLFGYEGTDLLGEPIEILLPSGMQAHHKALRDGFLQVPTARPMGAGLRFSARHKDGHEISVEVGLRPLLAGTNSLMVLVSIIDHSDRERAERAEFFVQELTHRAKNMLMMILAISRQVGRASSDVESFETDFEQRLRSFSATYDVVENGEVTAAAIRDVVHSQFVLLTGDIKPNVRIDGPDLWLPARLSEALGLAIHELATNAIKHGALSVEQGVVDLCWGADSTSHMFHFDWKERHGPAVNTTSHNGFGTVILERVVPASFGGTASLSDSAEGFSWHLEAPLAVTASGLLGATSSAVLRS
jgi:PAS domain S-box-containing protein